MNEETFGDPKVRQLLVDHFVAIAVDSDERPDLAERFRDYAWPATVLLTPDAQIVVAMRGYRPPEAFARLLEQVAAGEHPTAPPEAAPSEEPADLERLRAVARRNLDGLYDIHQAGWGERQKYPYAAPVEHAFFRAVVEGESQWKERALATLEGFTKLVDPVDGGVYQYSLRGDWEHPHYERIAAVQAGALQAFSEAHLVTGDARWRTHAEAVMGYLQSTLRADAGGYYASQDADLSHEVPGDEYFALNAARRAALGRPRVDPHVYADLNGRIIDALVMAYRATGDSMARAAAVDAAERIESTRDARGLFPHEVGFSDGLRYLRDQAWMLRAELGLYEATGNGQWRARAIETADAAMGELAAPLGFFAHTADPAARGVFAERRVPLAENGVLARGLTHLARVTDEERYAAAAQSALRSQSEREVKRAGRRVGDYLLALEERRAPFVMLSVVGPDDDATAALQQAAFRVPFPHRIVELGRPGESRYPFPGRPAVFLCNESACSLPANDPAEFEERAQAFVVMAER